MSRRRDPIARLRSGLYLAARVLGDVQAVRRAVRKRSVQPLIDRAWNRAAGRAITGQVSRRVWR